MTHPSSHSLAVDLAISSPTNFQRLLLQQEGSLLLPLFLSDSLLLHHPFYRFLHLLLPLSTASSPSERLENSEGEGGLHENVF